MLSFTQYLSEEKKPAAGIQHIEHPSDRSFDNADAAHHALKTLKGVASGKTPLTRKIDDKMSFHAIRTPEGKVGVKYKGPGAHYNFSASDIDRQHGHKPYLVGPLKALHKHLGKVLPKHAGEYQGGYMSEPHTRETKDGHISHTPNTIQYHTPVSSEEGQKLHKSKVSATVHTELKGEHKTAHPITDTSHFGSHPDVHMVQHLVAPHERNLSSEVKASADHHLTQAEKLMKDHSYHHLDGHEITARSYINKTVTSEETPSVAGYKKHLQAVHQKKIDAVKTAAAKERKTATMHADLSHVAKNKEHFAKSFEIHHHLQQATNHLARGLDSSGGGGFHTKINGKAAGGEGYVANGLKVVDREGFSKANRERSAILRAGKGKKMSEVHHHITQGRMNPPTVGHEAVVNQVRKTAGEHGHTIILTGSHDSKKNPLTPEQKLKHAKRAFPGANVKLATKESPTMLHHLSNLHKSGVTHLHLHVGSDRAHEFHTLIHKYNGVEGKHGHFNFKGIKIHKVGGERSDADTGVGGASATKMRHHASVGNEKEFHKMAPSAMSTKHKHELYKDVRHGMGVHESLSFKTFLGL